MDGLSGAASVITVVSLALSSTQVIYNNLSAIRNGPETVQHMTSGLRSLSNLLRQLRGNGDSLYLASDLPELVQKCTANLNAFEEKLGKLSSSADKRTVRLWKNVKVTLQSKDLERMAAFIEQDVAALSLQLQIVERSLSSPQLVLDVQIDSIHSKAGVSHSVTLDRVEALSKTQIGQSTSNANFLTETASVVNQIGDNMKEFGATFEESRRGTRHILEQLGHKVQNLSTCTTGQSETLNAILELLQQQVSTSPQHSATQTDGLTPAVSHEKREMAEEAHKRPNDDGDGIQNALDRLCQLAEETEKNVFSEDAESIISDIQQVFDLLSKDEAGEQFKDRKGKRRRNFCEDNADNSHLQQEREVKRIKSLLTVSNSVAINAKASRPWAAKKENWTLRHTHHQRKSSYGLITVHTRRNRRAVANSSQKSTQDVKDDVLEVLEASVAFLPNNSESARIAVAFQQSNFHGGSFLETPVMTVSILLPDDSKVFQLIKSGDLKGLIKSLSLRESRLNDRDAKGRCLLNYALFNENAEICRFLIDQGADVDFVEQAQGELSEYQNFHSLEIAFHNDCEEDALVMKSTNRCRRLLLEGGADPTYVPDGDYNGSLLGRILELGTTESLRLLLDHGCSFIGTSDIIRPADFLSYHLTWQRWTVETVALLLQRQGRHEFPLQDLTNCLHHAICGSIYIDIDGLRDVLILLIRAGADIYKKEFVDGPSVSDISCDPETVWRLDSARRHGRFKSRCNHDLALKAIWVEALTSCGYDAEEVISGSLRVTDLSTDAEDEMPDQEDKSSQDGSDCSTAEDVDNPSIWSGDVSDHEEQSGDDEVSQEAGFAFLNHREQSLLEGDAQVWGA